MTANPSATDTGASTAAERQRLRQVVLRGMIAAVELRDTDELPSTRIFELAEETVRPIFAATAASIAAFGFHEPILVRGGVVVDGFTRLAAARFLEISPVPVIDLGKIGDVEAKAFRDAARALSSLRPWSVRALEAELATLPDVEDLATVLGLREVTPG